MTSPNALITSDYGPIIINLNDSQIGRHISEKGYWAQDDLRLIETLMNHLFETKSELTFYDIGANIGTHSLAVGKTFQSRVKIRAFEAQRQIFNMLCGTIALNGLDNVECHNLAVSGKAGETLEISLPNYAERNNFGGLELMKALRSDNDSISKSGIQMVNTTTIDSYNEPVDFIKMDIEGMEDQALFGAKKTLSTARPICFVEILKTDLDALVSLFTTYKYCGFQKSENLVAIPIERNIQINGLNRVF
jgi:FkbM family methyltransferase